MKKVILKTIFVRNLTLFIKKIVGHCPSYSLDFVQIECENLNFKFKLLFIKDEF